MKKRSTVNYLFILLLSIIIAGCQYGGQVNLDEGVPNEANCSNLSPQDALFQSVGITWAGITVGESTKDDVITKFGEPDVIVSQEGTIPFRGICWMFYRDGPHFWISQDRVIAVDLANFGFRTAVEIELPKDVQELRTLYGKPDFVGWHAPYNHPWGRLAVWPTEGVMANITIDSQQVASVVFFPPMSESDFLNSGLSQFISFTETPSGDIVDMVKRDPFNWEDE
ncbi:MAG: hypothetical protein KJ069_14845 [Anaerolineae bacterium]|nr:hypothetical protein [Anaerolineae bacterium]